MHIQILNRVQEINEYAYMDGWMDGYEAYVYPWLSYTISNHVGNIFTCYLN